MRLSPEIKLGCLSVVAALAVAYVEHGIAHHWASWDSVPHFLVSWFIDWIAVSAFVAAAAFAAIQFNRFFLGYEWKNENLEFYYHVLIAVLVAAILIAFLAHYLPTDDCLTC
jgi:hypothetical protein